MKVTAILASAVLFVAGVARANDAQRVLVTPFNVLNAADSQQWIGKGVQENVVADFGRNGNFAPIAFQGQVVVEDNATAARLARAAQSPLAIRGAAQSVGGSLRLTAQLIDSTTGDTVRTASVTGSATDLLKMEDELSAQLLGQATAPAGGAPAAATPVSTAQAPAAQVAPAPQIIVIEPQQQQAPYSNYGSYPDYSNYYPYYPYSYGYGPIWYGTLFPYVFTINVNHDHDHNHVDHHGGGGTVGGGGIGGIGGPTGAARITPAVSHGGMVPAVSPAASHGAGFRGGGR